jgi:S1-C subfamily serine protease
MEHHMTPFDELGSALQAAAEHSGPSIVGIGRRFRGSGMVIAPGLVLTNAHNLRGDETTVAFGDGRRENGRVRGVDADGDLAVLAVETGGAPGLRWSEAGVAIGNPVIGAAFAPPAGVRVTLGFVSAIDRAFRGPGGRLVGGSVEHTAALAPGSSGGPLLTADGLVAGINTSRLGDGFYLARPADAALRGRIDALGRGESTQRVRLGVALAPAHVGRRLRRSVGLPEADGLLVRAVEPGSLAERAGICEGDLIVAIAGRAATDVDALQDVLAATEPPFELTVLRGIEERTFAVEGPEAR